MRASPEDFGPDRQAYRISLASWLGKLLFFFFLLPLLASFFFMAILFDFGWLIK